MPRDVACLSTNVADHPTQYSVKMQTNSFTSVESLHTEELRLQFMCEDDKYEQKRNFSNSIHISIKTSQLMNQRRIVKQILILIKRTYLP